MTTNKRHVEIAQKIANDPYRLPHLASRDSLEHDIIQALASAERDAVERCVETIESFFSEFKDCMAKDCHHSERDNLIREIIKAIQGGKDEG